VRQFNVGCEFGVLNIAASEPGTDGSWTRIERKTQGTKSSNGASNLKTTFMSERVPKLLRSNDTDKHMEVRWEITG
jgi:hypothetical protein